MTNIHRSEINSEVWIDTSLFAADGREHFREKKQFGNRHAVFDKGSDRGTVHYDQYNATDFPTGTVNHLANFMSQRTGANEDLGRIAIWLAGGYLAYRAIRCLAESI